MRASGIALIVASHWLNGVAKRAGLAGADDLRIEPAATTAVAWEEATRVLGVTEAELAAVVARHFRLNVADLSAAIPSAARLVPETIVRRHAVLPLRENDREVVVATCNPADLEAEQAIGFASSRQAVFEIAPPGLLLPAIEALYSSDRQVRSLVSHIESPASGVSLVDHYAEEIAGAQEGDSSAIVKLTNLLLRAAVAQRATRIVIAPGPTGAVARFTVDGVDRHFMQMPIPAMNRVISRFKVLGNVGMANRAMSQDGTARIRVEGRSFGLRITIAGGSGAQSVSITLFDPAWQPKLADLGFEAGDLARLRQLLAQPGGLVVFALHPGSGTTTTVHAVLRDLAAARRPAAAIEDAVVVHVEGVEQAAVDRRAGVTAGLQLQRALDHGARVVALVPLTDTDAGRRAVRAARSDVLVLPVVKAEHAAMAMSILPEVGIERTILGDLLRGAVAQRLLRRLCPACATPVTEPLTPEETRLARAFAVRPVRRAVGCDRCDGIGYQGVLPVLQILTVSPALAPRIALANDVTELEQLALAEGTRTLAAAALARVTAGETTLQEVHRALSAPVPASDTVSREPRILIADDDPEIRLLTRTILETNGHRVTEVDNGAAALAAIGAGEDLALVILDLEMPRMDGRSVLRRLKQDVRTAGLPVLVLTGSARPETEVEVMEDGAADYVRKPVDPPRFLARVRAALRRHGG